MADEEFRRTLASARSLQGAPPYFDPTTVPGDPMALFRSWFLDAMRAGVPEPHAMTLSTVDAVGRPDARVLILKAVEGDRMAFAGGAESAKGRELAAQPSAALTFWWQALRRSVRVRGSIAEGSMEEHRDDFADRGANARAAALVSGDAPLRSRAALEAEARAVGSEAHDPRWRRWWLTPASVEFWQGSPDRLHQRLRYDCSSSGWIRRLLRPEGLESVGLKRERGSGRVRALRRGSEPWSSPAAEPPRPPPAGVRRRALDRRDGRRRDARPRHGRPAQHAALLLRHVRPVLTRGPAMVTAARNAVASQCEGHGGRRTGPHRGPPGRMLRSLGPRCRATARA